MNKVLPIKTASKRVDNVTYSVRLMSDKSIEKCMSLEYDTGFTDWEKTSQMPSDYTSDKFIEQEKINGFTDFWDTMIMDVS